MAKKIDNYTSEIREKNKHFFINGSNTLPCFFYQELATGAVCLIGLVI